MIRITCQLPSLSSRFLLRLMTRIITGDLLQSEAVSGIIGGASLSPFLNTVKHMNNGPIVLYRCWQSLLDFLQLRVQSMRDLL